MFGVEGIGFVQCLEFWFGFRVQELFSVWGLFGVWGHSNKRDSCEVVKPRHPIRLHPEALNKH